MYPVLFEIGGFVVTSYGAMVLLAFVAGGWLTAVQLRRRALDGGFAWDMLAWVAVGGLLGAKVYYWLLHWQDVMANPAHELINRAGLVWYGGLIGGALAFLWYARKRKMPLLPTLDAAAPALAVGHALGRVGCFLVGENYGRPTDSWAGIAFPVGNPPSTAANLRAVGVDIPAGVPDSALLTVHPTQLYEIGLLLAIFAVLWRVSRRNLHPGRLFALYLVLSGIERFLIEFVRAKDDRFVFGVLTTSQVFALFGVGLAVFLWQRRGAVAGRLGSTDAEAVPMAPS